jgi:hypothetical protein
MAIEKVTLTITIETAEQKDAILDVLNEAEMNGELDFVFNCQTEFLTSNVVSIEERN